MDTENFLTGIKFDIHLSQRTAKLQNEIFEQSDVREGTTTMNEEAKNELFALAGETPRGKMISFQGKLSRYQGNEEQTIRNKTKSKNTMSSSYQDQQVDYNSDRQTA